MSITNEAQARIKINSLLLESGWRFFDDQNIKANVVLESILRRLDKAGEPFYPWHLKHAIGSPLARRNLISPKGDQHAS